jgi:hypothetical protein
VLSTRALVSTHEQVNVRVEVLHAAGLLRQGGARARAAGQASASPQTCLGLSLNEDSLPKTMHRPRASEIVPKRARPKQVVSRMYIAKPDHVQLQGDLHALEPFACNTTQQARERRNGRLKSMSESRVVTDNMRLQSGLES